ncbi:MAG TPA: zinc ribbon domain-containing protein [Bacilli bacterium]|nr:zinc ribbon domain-containing protein [Bacilli bacterium]
MYCPKCGKIIDDNSSFCPSCGVDTAHGEVVVAKKETKSIFASVAVVFAIISFVCLLISFLLGYVVGDDSAVAFNIFSTTFLVASFPFFVISMVKQIYEKRSILHALLALVFIAVAFIFCLITSGTLLGGVKPTADNVHSFYLSVLSMTLALDIAAIIFGALSINRK